MSENRVMTGKELVKALQKLSKARKQVLRIENKRGKGSHVTLYLGGQYAVIHDLEKELKTGTLNAILKQLGMEKGEYEPIFIFSYLGAIDRRWIRRHVSGLT
jgi:mRNA interferase HicA